MGRFKGPRNWQFWNAYCLMPIKSFDNLSCPSRPEQYEKQPASISLILEGIVRDPVNPEQNANAPLLNSELRLNYCNPSGNIKLPVKPLQPIKAPCSIILTDWGIFNPPINAQ